MPLQMSVNDVLCYVKKSQPRIQAQYMLPQRGYVQNASEASHDRAHGLPIENAALA
jgi:hypothetical protein